MFKNSIAHIIVTY